MLRPPTCLENKTFATLEQLLHEIQTYACAEAYAVRKRRRKSDRTTGLPTAVYLECDRARKSQPPEEIRRASSSRACGCPWDAVLRLREDRWQLEIRNGSHNHAASLGPSAHPAPRRAAMTPAVRQLVAGNCAAGVRPHQTMAAIRMVQPDAPLVMRDLYNQQQLLKLEAQDGQSKVKALLNDLETKNDA